jgi:hypothetical protein
MMTRDERLLYWEKIEAAQAAWLADPEIAAEYARASQAWDATVSDPSRSERRTLTSIESQQFRSRPV